VAADRFFLVYVASPNQLPNAHSNVVLLQVAIVESRVVDICSSEWESAV